MLTNALYYKTIESPVGPLRLIASERGLCAVLFHDGAGQRVQMPGELVENDVHPVLVKAEKQLTDYFAGKRHSFDLKLDVRGTVFQQKTWRELQKIPYGETISYGEQARRMGDSKKARAAGMANGRNPLAIVIPCHRVIGANGTLTGFGGGLKAKDWLLKHEQRCESGAVKARKA